MILSVACQFGIKEIIECRFITKDTKTNLWNVYKFYIPFKEASKYLERIVWKTAFFPQEVNQIDILLNISPK